MEVIEGPKRFSKVFIDEGNFAYQVNRKRPDGGLILRCYDSGCHGSGVFVPQKDQFKPIAKHNHNADPAKTSRWRFLHRIKERSESEKTPIKDIYEQESLKCPDIALPDFKKIHSTLCKRRRSCQNPKGEIHTPEGEVQYVNCVDEFDLSKPLQIDDSLKCPNALKSFILPDGYIVEIIEGPRRFSKLYVDNYSHVYLLNKKRQDGGVILRCHTDGCNASGVYNPRNGTFKKITHHSHLPDPDVLVKMKFLNHVKERSENENTDLKTIYDQEAAQCPGVPLPTFNQIKTTLRKRRKARESAIQKSEEMKGQFGPTTYCLALENVGEVLGSQFTFGIPSMEVIEGPKRHSKIYIDEASYTYQVNRRRPDGRLILRCYEDGCHGSGVFNPTSGQFRRIANHSHHADLQLVTKWRFLNRVKERAENESTSLKTIYEEEFARFQVPDLPAFKQIESTLQKRRRVVQPGGAKTVHVEPNQGSGDLKIEGVAYFVESDLAVQQTKPPEQQHQLPAQPQPMQAFVIKPNYAASFTTPSIGIVQDSFSNQVLPKERSISHILAKGHKVKIELDAIMNMKAEVQKKKKKENKEETAEEPYR